LLLSVRRFRCTNADCAQSTFVEQFPKWLPAYARHTTRLNELIRQIGIEVGGEAGRRILRYFKIPVSGDTIIRRVRQTQLDTSAPPRVIGIDDWAFKKGRSYGTIIVDQEAHRVIDLLDDRTAPTLASWLQTHPGIEVIASDRSTDYAAGIQAGCPQAIQVADRWHLLLNLGQMLERFLTTIYSRLEPVPIASGQAYLFPSQRNVFPRTNADQARSQTSRERRMMRYETIRQLRCEGYNISQIVRALGLHREPVRKNYYATTFPERKRRKPGYSILDPYLPYLEQRVHAGCENGMQLWREIHQQGYPGTHKQVLRWLQYHRTQPAPSTPKIHLSSSTGPSGLLPDVWRLPSIKQLAWLLSKPPDKLAEYEVIVLAHLQNDPDIAVIYPLTQQFASMIRDRQVDDLDTWLQAGLDTSIVPLCNFVIGLQQEYASVRAALELPWSNGQTEGQVNRLKFIKRQMYGRAHFDLLRIRVLHYAGST
jgi:transposase